MCACANIALFTLILRKQFDNRIILWSHMVTLIYWLFQFLFFMIWIADQQSTQTFFKNYFNCTQSHIFIRSIQQTVHMCKYARMDKKGAGRRRDIVITAMRPAWSKNVLIVEIKFCRELICSIMWCLWIRCETQNVIKTN